MERNRTAKQTGGGKKNRKKGGDDDDEYPDESKISERNVRRQHSHRFLARVPKQTNERRVTIRPLTHI